MAGMCPGVGVPHRRKINKQPRQDSQSSRFDNPLETLIPAVSTLDETALRARQRLERKLCYLYPASRSSGPQSNTRSVHKSEAQKKDTHLAKDLLGKPLNFQLKRWKNIGRSVLFA